MEEQKLKHIPNILTICRLMFIPFIVGAIISEDFILAIILFTLSSITDVLDGIIARKFNFISNFGKLMDPVADKLTQVAITFTLAANGVIPVWIVIALVTKEMVMIGGGLYLYKRKDVVVHSKWYGKLTTVLIYVAVVSSFLINIIPELQFTLSYFGHNVTFDIVIYAVAMTFAAFSLLSYIQYFWKDIFKMNKKEKN